MLNLNKLALTGGIYWGGCMAIATILSLMGVSGFPPFTNLLVQFYGPWGYSVTVTGIFIGAFWGFVEGFVHLYVFGWLYRYLTK